MGEERHRPGIQRPADELGIGAGRDGDDGHAAGGAADEGDGVDHVGVGERAVDEDQARVACLAGGLQRRARLRDRVDLVEAADDIPQRPSPAGVRVRDHRGEVDPPAHGASLPGRR